MCMLLLKSFCNLICINCELRYLVDQLSTYYHNIILQRQLVVWSPDLTQGKVRRIRHCFSVRRQLDECHIPEVYIILNYLLQQLSLPPSITLHQMLLIVSTCTDPILVCACPAGQITCHINCQSVIHNTLTCVQLSVLVCFSTRCVYALACSHLQTYCCLIISLSVTCVALLQSFMLRLYCCLKMSAVRTKIVLLNGKSLFDSNYLNFNLV